MKLYNTLSRSKEEFKPIVEKKVTMYSCGPTVYNYFHIGNARPFIIFDTLRRYFDYRGYDVKFVQNFTDIDDKMINRANEEGITIKELADRFISEYFIDAKALGVHEPSVCPRATDNIDAIIELISNLEKKGYAYNVDGDVYYDTSKFDGYGKLSHQSVDDLRSGARVSIDERKNDPIDFALWKAAKPGEPSWDSPWGKGRPGWHIECSAMANRFLGETIDIHSGGQDLIFPHHENEIAQSEAVNGKPFANYWLHNGFINVDNEKMSKSAGNFFTVREIAKKFDYEMIRFFMLSAHYRSPINFSAELLEQSKNGLDRIYQCLGNLEYNLVNAKDDKISKKGTGIIENLEKLKVKFIEAMDDDINTAAAISVIFEIVKEVNVEILADENASKELINFSISLIKELGDVLGILQKKEDCSIENEIEELIEKRQQARADRDWKLADEIRDTLNSKGILLEDTPQGVKWRKA
ncbi:MAG: cysteine--tRNA ligase [Clostridia bacterium]|jgi:cysteinyl-tRNA synthetase